MAPTASRPRVLPAVSALLMIAATGCVLQKLAQLAPCFAAGGSRYVRPQASVRGSRVALGPKFLKDLGLEKPDFLPDFGKGGETAGQEGATEAAETDIVTGAAGEGDSLPEIRLPNQDGGFVSISSFKGGSFFNAGKPVVLFFFAGSASPSCTKECQAFRDSYAKFQEKGAEVIGVSLDSPSFNAEFKGKEELPFDLLSDEGGKIAQALQIPKDVFGLLNGRQTYVIDQEGKIKKVFNSQFEPEKHVDVSLSAL